MSDPSLVSRRAFLAGSAGLALAAACGGGGSKSSPTSATTGAAKLAGAVASSDLYVGAPQRFAFGIIKNDTPLNNAAGVQVAFAPLNAPAGPAVPAAFHGQGLPERGVYVVESTTFDRDGTWEAHIALAGRTTTVPFLVNAKAQVPAPGGGAPKAPSPTPADPLGVDPICTRQPPCPLHSVSLDKLIGAGKPVAVMFATPARCQSRFCGPVLDLLLAQQASYQSRINMVHVEIFKNATDITPVPTIAAWSLESEPWLFGIDGNGVVKGRIDGAFDAPEVKALLDSLVA